MPFGHSYVQCVFAYFHIVLLKRFLQAFLVAQTISSSSWMPTTSGRLSLLPYGIVVEPSAIRGLAADCPLYGIALRFTPYAILAIFSDFSAITIDHLSYLRCGLQGFRGSQQFDGFAAQLTLRWD